MLISSFAKKKLITRNIAEYIVIDNSSQLLERKEKLVVSFKK